MAIEFTPDRDLNDDYDETPYCDDCGEDVESESDLTWIDDESILVCKKCLKKYDL